MERVKSEAAEAAKKMLEEMQKKNEQMMQEKEVSYQEHMKQLTAKMETERAQLAADQERVLALKLQVFNCNISILSSTVLNQKLLEHYISLRTVLAQTLVSISFPYRFYP